MVITSVWIGQSMPARDGRRPPSSPHRRAGEAKIGGKEVVARAVLQVTRSDQHRSPGILAVSCHGYPRGSSRGIASRKNMILQGQVEAPMALVVS